MIALVTGARGGLGPHVVRAFEGAGDTVIGTGREVDAGDPAAMEALVARIESEHGRLDACAALVGGWAGGTPLSATSLEDFRRMIDLNLITAFATARAVVPALVRAGGGALVLVGSRAVERPDGGAAAYAAAKSGVVSLVRSLAVELAHTPVRVNAVLPGIIDTPANRAAMPGANVETWVPAERLAQVIRFLCSSEAKDVRGVALPVYGRL